MQETWVQSLGWEDPLQKGMATHFSILALLGNINFPGGSDGKESTCDTGDLGSIPGLERSPGGGHGNPLQYSLENPRDRGAWWATVHGVTKSQTRQRLNNDNK